MRKREIPRIVTVSLCGREGQALAELDYDGSYGYCNSRSGVSIYKSKDEIPSNVRVDKVRSCTRPTLPDYYI